MRKLAGIIRYTFVEVFRNKVYYVLLLFSGVILLGTLLLGSLGGEQRSRMIIDMGLASIETFALAVAVFAAVTLVLEEMEQRTLYLILTRPVARAQFVVGRFLGLIAIISLAYVVMAAAHATLCHGVGVSLDRHYALSLYFSWQKIVLITAIAMVFSLFATSTVSAVTFTSFFWVMGHFSDELRYLSQKASQPLVSVLTMTFYYLAPNFAILNVRDIPSHAMSLPWLWAAGGYAIGYTVVALVLASLLFRRKEF